MLARGNYRTESPLHVPVVPITAAPCSSFTAASPSSALRIRRRLPSPHHLTPSRRHAEPVVDSPANIAAIVGSYHPSSSWLRSS